MEFVNIAQGKAFFLKNEKKYRTNNILLSIRDEYINGIPGQG